jgi:hypothetical protein
MRRTEFWARMRKALGDAYADSYARDQVLRTLGGRTPLQALDEGEDTKTVWRAVWAELELPASER